MSKKSTQPAALTIAGSDSGGGAGIQADLKTFAALGVHGASAITCLTAQNPRGVFAIEACAPKIVRAQIAAVIAGFHPLAAKTGMLYSAEIISAVSKSLHSQNRMHLVVDPVMISTSGRRLLKANAFKAFQAELLPLATLLTPNLAEAEILIRHRVRSVAEMRQAARQIFETYGCAALVKGGHLANAREAVDIFYDGQTELLLSAPFIKGLRTHGTGCTYSAAITAQLALGLKLPLAVTRAKEHITQAIAHSNFVAGHAVLNNFWRQK